MSDLSRVVFYIGEMSAKRRAFRKSVSKSVAFADNDEVLASIDAGGKTTLIIGENPYSDMTVYEFARYHKTVNCGILPGQGEIKDFFRRFLGESAPLSRRVGRLTPIEYRALTLFTVISDQTERVIVNFDGLPYTRSLARKLNRLTLRLSERYDVCVSVSDRRFIINGAKTVKMGERRRCGSNVVLKKLKAPKVRSFISQKRVRLSV